MRAHVYAATAAFLLLLRAPLALAEDPDASPERVFLPEFEFGVMGYGRRDIGVGFVARTSIEYRPALTNAGFARLTYDTTSASFSTPMGEGLPRLRGTHSAHDVLVGGGYRTGSETVQVAFGVQGGLHLDAIPRLVESDALEVSAATRVGAAVRGSVGVELYIEPESAVTLEVLGQRMWGPIWQARDGWAGGATAGFTTAP
ncbi:MAG: hypothetical protein AAF602_01330 [Myxococcota bacterium]